MAYDFSPEFAALLKKAGYDPSKITYDEIWAPQTVIGRQDENGKTSYGYYDDDNTFHETNKISGGAADWEGGSSLVGYFPTGKKGIVYDHEPVTLETARTPDNQITRVTLGYDEATKQPTANYSYDRVADSGSWWNDLRDLGESAGVVAGNYFLPGSSILTSKLVSEGAKDNLSNDLFKVSNIGAGAAGALEGNLSNWTGGTTSAPTIDTIAADYYGVPAGSEYVAPTATTLGTVAGSTEGMLAGATPEVAGMGGAQGLTMPSATNLAEMGGAQGLGGGTTLSGLADMGGAQGLVAGASALPLIGAMDAGTSLGAGEALGAVGVGGALTPAAAGVGTNLGLSDAATGVGSALAGSTAANALTGAAAGSTLADILPYTTAASLAGGYLQSQAAKEAAQIQADAAAKALAQQQANFNTINAQQAPYRAAGYGALNQIANLGGGGTQQYDANGNPIGATTGASDYLTHQFNAADLKAGLAPNYDFMLQQGQMANQRAANAGGGAIGGNALQGLNKYTQDYAGNAYQNAFTNYQNQRSNIYNTLANIAGIGQTGQNATNTAATNATNAASQLGVGSAAAQAAGTTGSANAYTNAINNATGNYTLASLLNQRGNVQMPVA